MGHSIIQCRNCGRDIMEGCNDWHCDQCGWFCGNGVDCLSIASKEAQRLGGVWALCSTSGNNSRHFTIYK